jgi:hypothetical protein
MPPRRELPPSEMLEAMLNLRSQYESLIRSLNETGLLQLLPKESALGIVGIDPEHPDSAREYPVPSLESIQNLIKEHAQELEPKVNQGFNKLVLVPIAAPLSYLRMVYGNALKLHHQNKQLFNSHDLRQDLNIETPLWAWDVYDNADGEGKLVYYPERFEPNNHGGITKLELIRRTTDTSFPGWEVKLIEDLPNLPAEGSGQTIGGRKQVEANRTPMDYLAQPRTDPHYKDEQGLTPEDWLTLAIDELHNRNKILDEYQGRGKIAYLTGAWFPFSGSVPCAFFGRAGRRASLSRTNPGFRVGYYSARRSVRVGKKGAQE